MTKVKSLRVSIKPHNTQFLTALAEQMGCDLNEALNYLLLDIKGLGYQFGTPLSMQAQPQAIAHTIEKNLEFTPYKPAFTSTDDGLARGYLPQVQSEIDNRDEVLERFIAIGLDSF